MATSYQDEEYLDDDFDIDGDEFLELQQEALKATQKQQQQLLPALRSQGTRIDTTNKTVAKSSVNNIPYSPQLRLHAQRSSEYGEIDEEVLDTDVGNTANVILFGAHAGLESSYVPGEVTQRERWRAQRFSGPSKISHNNVNDTVAALPHRSVSQSTPPDGQNHRREPINGESSTKSKDLKVKNDFEIANNVDSLEARLVQLMSEKHLWDEERARLEQDVKIANDKVLGKNGEISILRSNYARKEKEHERVISDLKQQQAVHDEHHRQELAAAKREKESLATHNKFLDHEMSKNTWPSNRPPRSKEVNGNATPRRQRSANLGDGFNDDEMVISPSKSAAKAKAATPKQGAKRKREVFLDSPGQPLQFSQDAANFTQETNISLPTNHLLKASSSSIKDTRFEFLQSLLGHRIQPGVKRTFEVFTSFALPSASEVTISTIFADRMAQTAMKQETIDYPAFIGSIIISIWSECLNERYFAPVRYLIDLLQFVLLHSGIATVDHLVADITRISQLTADINIIPRFKSLTKMNKTGPQHDSSLIEPSDEIDIHECLQLLTLTATICATDSNLVKHFWRSMRFDFISMLLRVSQHIDDITMTVKLLEPCVQDDQLGTIRPHDPAASLTFEQHVIDRLTSMLIETPKPIPGAEPYDAVDVVEMRLEILMLLAQICDNKLSGKAFAMHPQALGRVVRVMNDELTALYIDLSGEEMRSEVVNQACRIIFYVTSTYSSEIDLQEKLRSQPGGVNKYLIALSRLAFSDAIFFERGIEDDVFDYAHLMLEDFVTPEEGEALRKAFVKDE